ncbi:glutamyl-tRNA amidotransferase [Candidatus Endobugula sertula]|uniref:Glutamyl-tRNA amidotransferase n=1 Tax=Candidatus Endobugula sertula TaxID=62101 RepID=A0A1D2QRQ7_9GAMM|nr:glutamyl-tRNA amidotransferase [Candidatus Endobugula sertula]
MATSELQSRIHNEMKATMRAKNKSRLGVIRLIQSEFKRIEVDERIELDDSRVLAVLDKMVKQRRDSAKQYEDANRQELADQEHFEISIITEFLPQPLSDDEITTLIDDAVNATNASGMQDMGKVMGILKPQLQGRADIGHVSKQVKTKIS